MSRKKSEWLRHVEQWRSGTLSRKEYCEKHTINIGTFRTWCARYTKLKAKRELGLVEVTPKPEPNVESQDRGEYSIEIVTERGIVRVGNGVDGALLTRVLERMGVR